MNQPNELSGNPQRFPTRRWILAPITTWRARRMVAEYGPGMDARTAWALTRVADLPEEIGFALHHLRSDQT